MKRNDLIGIVCSKDLSEAYCIAGSEYYKKEIVEKGLRNETMIVYIPQYLLNHLIHESFNCNKFSWDMKKILEYQIK